MHFVYFFLIVLGELVLILGIMAVWGFKSKHPRLALILLLFGSVLLTFLLEVLTKF